MNAILQEESAIRLACEDDIQRIMQIEQAAYEFPWTQNLIENSIDNNYFFCVLLEQGEIVGYGIMSCVVDEASILNLCVDPQWQGNGLGSQLLNYLLDIALQKNSHTVFLEVRASNMAAQRLYEDAGFNQLGIRRGYYPAGNRREDALLYAKSLTF